MRGQPDFLKVRTMLPQDPRLLRMVAELSAELPRNFHGTSADSPRDICGLVRNAVVGGLVRVWSVVRHTAESSEIGDALLPYATLQTIDDMAEMVGFGRAMAAVHWLEETAQGVILPGFFAAMNSDPNEDRKRRDRERKAKNRDKLKSVDVSAEVRGMSAERPRNSTVEKRREEKRREESNSPTLTANAVAATGIDGYPLWSRTMTIPLNWSPTEFVPALDTWDRYCQRELNRGPMSDLTATEICRKACSDGWDAARLAKAISTSIANRWSKIGEEYERPAGGGYGGKPKRRKFDIDKFDLAELSKGLDK